jgi:hypothetical protein
MWKWTRFDYAWTYSSTSRRTYLRHKFGLDNFWRGEKLEMQDKFLILNISSSVTRNKLITIYILYILLRKMTFFVLLNKEVYTWDNSCCTFSEFTDMTTTEHLSVWLIKHSMYSMYSSKCRPYCRWKRVVKVTLWLPYVCQVYAC